MNRYEGKKAYTLDGVDGNAYSVMGYVLHAMKDAYRVARSESNEEAVELWGPNAQQKYSEDARSSDYNHLLAVSCEKLDDINDYLGLEEDDDDNIDWREDEDW